MPRQPTPVQLAGPLAVLVDEHPLDAYLAIAALRPPSTILLYGPGRASEAERLARVAGERLGVRMELRAMDDDTSAVVARRTYTALPDDVHLHHTGGDGSMAADLLAAHAGLDRPIDAASVLDEERRLLRLGDGVDLPLAALVDPSAVTIDVLLDLNGFVRVTDAHAARVLEQGQSIVRSAEPWPWADTARLAGHGRSAIDHLRTHLDRFRPSSGPLADEGSWYAFRNGTFVEVLLAEFVRACAPSHEVEVGLQLEHGAGMRLELDVMAVGRYRPYVFSCMAGDTTDTAKKKAFEVVVRARQVGGLTVRPALVSALSADDAARVAAMATVDAADPSGSVRILGIEDLVALGLDDNPSSRRRLLGLEDPPLPGDS